MSGRKKVVFDNDDIQIYYPLSRDWCSYNEFWCKGHGGRQDTSEYLDRLVKTTPGSYYILVKKEKNPRHNQTYLMIGNRVPLKFDGNYSLRDNDFDTISIKKLLGPHKEAASFLNLKYTLKERIKYDVQFTEEELNNWAGINEFSKTVKGIIDNKIHYNGLFEHIGEELNEYEDYSWKATNQIKFGVNGIELFIDNDQYVTDILALPEDDEYYYKRAMGVYHYDDSEEVDSEELDYMSCWLELDTIHKLDKVFNLYGIEKDSTGCSDYDEAEINDFLIKHFPLKWERIGWDILSEAGYGLTKQRTEDAKQYIEDETTFEFDVGNSQTTMELTHNQLLFLIHAHELEDLSGLIDPKNTINELDAGLYDSWYDSYDFGDSYEEIDRIFSVFLDGLLENSDEIVIRKKNSELLDSIIRQVGLELKTYNNSYSAYINDNSIALYNIDLVKGTATLTKTVKQPAPDKPEETVPAGELMAFRKNFNLDISDVPLYIDPDNIFADPTEEKNIKTTP